MKQKPNPPDSKLKNLPLVNQYLQFFNQKDWNNVYQLLKADARLEIVGVTTLDGRENIKNKYFVNYGKLPGIWKKELALVDGEPMVVHFIQEESGAWKPESVLLMEWNGNEVQKIRDYVHVEYLLENAEILPLNDIR